MRATDPRRGKCPPRGNPFAAWQGVGGGRPVAQGRPAGQIFLSCRGDPVYSRGFMRGYSLGGAPPL